MNKVILMGRLTRDPEVRYTQSDEPLAIARYSLAVNKRFKRQGEPDADFIPCVAFGKQGEFAERYFRKGQMVSIVGRLQVRNWEDNEGRKRTTTEVVVEEQYFAESKRDEEKTINQGTRRTSDAESGSAKRSADRAVKEKNQAPEGFYPIDDNIEDDDLPF